MTRIAVNRIYRSTVLGAALLVFAGLAQSCYHAPEDQAAADEQGQSDPTPSPTPTPTPTHTQVVPPPLKDVVEYPIPYSNFTLPMQVSVNYPKHSITIVSLPSQPSHGFMLYPKAGTAHPGLPHPGSPIPFDPAAADPGDPAQCDSYRSYAQMINNHDVPDEERAEIKKLLRTADPVQVDADIALFANQDDLIKQVVQATKGDHRELNDPYIVNPFKITSVTLNASTLIHAITAITQDLPSVNLDLQRLSMGTAWTTRGHLSGKLADRDFLCDLRDSDASAQITLRGKADQIGNYTVQLAIDSLAYPDSGT